MDPQIFQKGVQRTPKFENLDTSLQSSVNFDGVALLFVLQEVQELFTYFDKDGAGGIDIDEFYLAFRVSHTCIFFTIVKRSLP